MKQPEDLRTIDLVRYKVVDHCVVFIYSQVPDTSPIVLFQSPYNYFSPAYKKSKHMCFTGTLTKFYSLYSFSHLRLREKKTKDFSEYSHRSSK